MIIRPQEDARGVGQRRRRSRHCAHEGAEARELFAVDRVRGFFRRHQVAHDQSEAQATQPAAFVDQHLRVLCAKAKPVHAGVEVDDGVQGLVEALGGRPPGIQLGQVIEHGNEAVLHEIAFGAGKQAVQHVDRQLGQHAAECYAFVDMRHEELPAAFGRQQGTDHGRPHAVGIGLQNGGAVDRPAGGATGIAQPAPIGGNRAQVDGKDRAGAARRVMIVGN